MDDQGHLLVPQANRRSKCIRLYALARELVATSRICGCLLAIACLPMAGAWAASIVPAEKSEWVYYWPYDVGRGIPDTGCDDTDIAAAQKAVAAEDMASTNICNAQFSQWTTAWPNLEGRTSWRQMCPASGVPITWGYQHKEERRYKYAYDYGSPCGQVHSDTGSGTIERHFFYYCADSVNYELYQPPYQPGPMIPACRLKAGLADPDKQLRGSDTCPAQGAPCEGDPIDVATGNMYEKTLDYRSGDATPLAFERHYNSRGPGSGSLGSLWRHTYDRKLEFVQLTAATTVARLHRPNGRIIKFDNSSGTWAADADIVERLISITTPVQGWRFTDDRDSVEIYDSNGRLLSIATRSGATTTLTYDLSGRLSTVTDPHGRQLGFGYDPSNRISTLTVPGGGTYQYGYDIAGNLAAVTDPDLKVRTYIYNEPANTSGVSLPNALTGILDEGYQRFATWQYDAQGRATRSENANGANRLMAVYNADGTVTVTDALGATRTHTFVNTLGVMKLASIAGSLCQGCGQYASYTYDYTGFLLSRKDARGVSTAFSSFGQTARRLETSRTDAPGTSIYRSTQTAWHATYRMPTLITEGNRRTAFTHDANGNILSRTITDLATSQSRTWTYTYDAFGKLLTEDGPRTDVPDVTTWTYHNCTTGFECGQVYTITNALGHLTTYSVYNAHGQPLSITDPNGVGTTLSYDARQRLISRSAGGETTVFDYWPTGLLQRVTFADGSYLDYSYDAGHRLTGIADNEGNRIAYTLDAMGNRIQEDSFDPSYALARTRSWTTNLLNQVSAEIGAANTPAVTTTFGYDNNGNRTSVQGPLGRNTSSLYDELNRLKQVTDPGTGITRFTYDRFDALKTVTDPRNKVTTYNYNNLGDLTSQISPDTGTTTNTYESAGNLLSQTDARGQTATYGYDALNRVTSVTYPDQIIAYTYDTGIYGNGRLSSVTDGSGSSSWTYTAQGRTATRGQFTAGLNRTVSHTYDTAGQLISLTYPSGVVVNFGYTAGKVTSIVSGAETLLTGVLYDPFGPVRGWTWGNSSVAVRTYDLDGSPTQLDSGGLKTYTLDDAFRITGITDASDPSRTWTYGYDLQDRLTAATRSGLSQGWTYDANGNRLSQTGSMPSTYSVASASNRLNGVSGAVWRSYAYDAAGNTTADGTATFSYNAAGRMISATRAGATTTYAHNALGQRVRKTTGGVTTIFVYDEAGHLLGEYEDLGVPIREYVWLGDIPVAVITGGPGTPPYLYWYIHTDHLNTPRMVENPTTGQIVWRWDSAPFGEATPDEDPDGDMMPFTMPLRFPGQYADVETGLHYNYFRDYEPQTGRYVQSDPIGLDGGINTYSYVDGRPSLSTDPSGQCPWCIAVGIGALTGAGIDFGLQLVEHGGRLDCVDWEQVGGAAAAGAALSGLGPTGFLLGRGGTRAAQYGYSRAPGLLNRWRTRFGWSGPKNGYDVLRLRSPRIPGRHLDVPGVRLPSGARPLRDGAVSGAIGGVSTNAGNDPCDECTRR